MFTYMFENTWHRINPEISTRCVRFPEYYNIQNLPTYIKNIIKDEYLKYIDNIKKTYKNNTNLINHTQQELNSIILYMYEKPPKKKQFNMFFTITEKLDKIRNENWKQSLPELYDLLKGEI